MSDVLIRGMEIPKSCTDIINKKHCPLRSVCRTYAKAHFHEKIQSADKRLEPCMIVGKIVENEEKEHKGTFDDPLPRPKYEPPKIMLL